MKKLLYTALLLPFFFFSCYIWDYSANSRVAIGALSGMPADIKAVHYAVFDGYPDGTNLLLSGKLGRGDSGGFEVPPGNNRYFLFVAESVDGLAKYIYLTVPYNISEGDSIFVPVVMELIVDPATFYNSLYDRYLELDFRSGYIYIYPVPGASLYEARNNGDVFYSGPYPFYVFTDNWGNHQARAYFEIFNLYTEWGEDQNYG